jgi:hypothetical protein
MTHGGHRPGAGRKPDAGEKRTVRIIIVLTPTEHAELVECAGAEPLAAWVRTRSLAAARSESD